MGRYEVCLPSQSVALAFQEIVQAMLDRIERLAPQPAEADDGPTVVSHDGADDDILSEMPGPVADFHDAEPLPEPVEGGGTLPAPGAELTRPTLVPPTLASPLSGPIADLSLKD